MKNQSHPQFKGSRRSRKDPATTSGKSKEMLKKGYGKRVLSGTATHPKFLGH